MYAFRWREAMTFAYMPYWKKVDAKVEGASQRIQEDCMNFARIVESIGLQIIRAIMLLIAFIPILWGLSSNVIIPWLKDISGSLVYVSLTASLGGVLISWLVGIKLPGLEYNNQVVEAAFRKNLFMVKMTELSMQNHQQYLNFLPELNLTIIVYFFIMVILTCG